MISGHATVQIAIEAIKLGAYEKTCKQNNGRRIREM